MRIDKDAVVCGVAAPKIRGLIQLFKSPKPQRLLKEWAEGRQNMTNPRTSPPAETSQGAHVAPSLSLGSEIVTNRADTAIIHRASGGEK
jgi:hypothetical protein